MVDSGNMKAFDVALLSPRAGEEERLQLGISREGVTLLQTDGKASPQSFLALASNLDIVYTATSILNTKT